MIKRILALLATVYGVQAVAMPSLVQLPAVNLSQVTTQIMADAQPMGLEDWKVGDSASYKLNIGGFINGTLEMIVREETEEGFWVDQNANLGFAGEQKIEILIDKHTGRVIKMIVNGEEQEPPADEGNTEIVEVTETQVTVPKGTFDCLYIKMRDKSNDQTSEAWVNPAEVPVSGMLKSVAPSQFGPVVIELTDFTKL